MTDKPMTAERLKWLERVSKLEGHGWGGREQELIAEACREIRRLRQAEERCIEHAAHNPQGDCVYCDVEQREETIAGHEAAMRKLCAIARGCCEKDEEGAWAIIMNHWDPNHLDRLSTLEEVTDEVSALLAKP